MFAGVVLSFHPDPLLFRGSLQNGLMFDSLVF
jgi:hypothetical protein